MPIVETKNINQGGIADSDYLGIKSSASEIVACNVHEEPGVIKVNQKLTSVDVEQIVDDFIKCSVSSSDGNQYFFGSTNGKVWKYNGTVLSLETTISPAAGGAGVLGASEYQNYIYYATESRLGRVAVGSPTNWASRDDDWRTFANTDPDFHPFKEINLVLYIGDAHYVAQVDSSLVTINYTGLSGTFVGGETVTGGTSGATGIIEFDDGSGTMQVKGVVGVFATSETITGGTSGATATTSTVEDAAFSDNALDIKQPLRIKCLGQLSTSLLIGTFVAENIVRAEILEWNTWSPSFTSSDPIPESGINAFIDMDNFVLVNAGVKGNMYLYNGSQLELYKKIKGLWSEGQEAVVHPNAFLNYNGIPLFGLSQKAGNPTKLGVYSMARHSRNYPYVYVIEYLISRLNTYNIEIGSFASRGGGQFLVTWTDRNAGGRSFGIDILDLSAKAPTAYITTRLINIDRFVFDNHGLALVAYRKLPVDTDINFYTKINHAPTFSSALEKVNDDMRKIVYTKEKIGEIATMQLKVEMTSSGNEAPEVEVIRQEIT